MTLVFVDNVDQAVQRALDSGGRLIDEAADQPLGLRQAVVADPEGYLWELSVHLHDVPVRSWARPNLALSQAEGALAGVAGPPELGVVGLPRMELNPDSDRTGRGCHRDTGCRSSTRAPAWP